MKRVEVEWWDSASADLGWRPQAEYRKEVGPLQCRTVGYLLNRTPKHVTVVQNWDRNDKVSDSMSIPRSCITKLRVLR
jgi:hypothetical protein